MNEDVLVDQSRRYEEMVKAEARRLMDSGVICAPDPFYEALRQSAERLVPDTWQWRIERVYGGSAIFFITGYTGA